MTQGIIFSVFDNKKGQIPLYSTINSDLATKIIQQVTISTMSTQSGEIDYDNFEGESILSFDEENILCFSYYFYIQHPSLLEGVSFSFISYLVPVDSRNEVYANINRLKLYFKEICDEIRSTFVPAKPIHESEVDNRLLAKFNESNTTLENLLGNLFKQPSIGVDSNLSFIKSVALIETTVKGTNFEVKYSEGILEEDVKNFAVRIMVGFLIKLSKADTTQGEAIIPIFESGQMAFSYFHQSSKNPDSVTIILIFTSDRLALYRWAPVISEDTRRTIEIFAEENQPHIAFNRLKILVENFETIIQSRLENLASIDRLVTEFSEDPVILLNFKKFEILIDSLLANEPIILVASNKNLAQAFIDAVAMLFPMRNMMLDSSIESEKDLLTINGNNILFLPKSLDKLLKNLKKQYCCVDVESKSIISGKPTNFSKSLLKQLKGTKDPKIISNKISDEHESLLNFVGSIVATAGYSDVIQAQEEIDRIMMGIPDRSSVGIIRKMAISYNPVLRDYIDTKAVYKLRDGLGI